MTERDAPEEALSLTVTRDTDRGGIERGRDENEIFLIFAERNRERDRVLPKEAGQCGVKRETGKKCLVKITAINHPTCLSRKLLLADDEIRRLCGREYFVNTWLVII